MTTARAPRAVAQWFSVVLCRGHGRGRWREERAVHILQEIVREGLDLFHGGVRVLRGLLLPALPGMLLETSGRRRDTAGPADICDAWAGCFDDARSGRVRCRKYTVPVYRRRRSKCHRDPNSNMDRNTVRRAVGASAARERLRTNSRILSGWGTGCIKK